MPDGIYYVTSGNSDLSLLDLIHPVAVCRLPLPVAGSTEVVRLAVQVTQNKQVGNLQASQTGVSPRLRTGCLMWDYYYLVKGSSKEGLSQIWDVKEGSI